MGQVVFHEKQPSILKWTKRFELWMCYGTLCNIAGFAWLWTIGDRIHDPQARLAACAFVGGCYLVLAALFWQIWDEDGKRRRDNLVARLWWKFGSLFEMYDV